MFYLLAIGSMLGYTVQNVLLVRYARQMDGLSFAFYRNISFCITLLPLCIGSTPGDVALVFDHWHLLAVSAFMGGCSIAISSAAYRSLGVGVVSTITKASSTLLMVVFAWWLLGETLPPASLLLIVFIACATFSLGIQRSPLPHLDNRHGRGMFLALFGTVPLVFAFISFTALSRAAPPLLSGYFWETAIAVACIILLLGRWVLIGQPLQKISVKTFLMIALCASPTLIGTGLFALATRIGPVAIVGAVGSASLVFTALLAWLLYKEPLRGKQWLSIAAVMGGIALLPLV